MDSLVITAYTTVSAAGSGKAALYDALLHNRSGLRSNDFDHADLKTWIGRIDGIEETTLPASLKAFDCRNIRLTEMALQQDGFEVAVENLKARHPSERIGLFIGTSTSGILSTELAYRQRDANGQLPSEYNYRYSQDLFSVSDYLRQRLGLNGPAFSVSTACSSSAKVFADAHRMISTGICDAAIVGGSDSLCLNTLYGFNSLELVSPQACRPCDSERNGITIGEASGLALLESKGEGAVALLGYGESSDAHHMSTPHPEGEGASQAMTQALQRAGINPSQVDYINMHGTATLSNDRSEDRGLQKLFGNKTPCSSTKGWTGHTLGAAGITEAIIANICIEHGFMPASLNTKQIDPDIGSQILMHNRSTKVDHVLSNSFGFGGSNCSLLFGRAPC